MVYRTLSLRQKTKNHRKQGSFDKKFDIFPQTLSHIPRWVRFVQKTTAKNSHAWAPLNKWGKMIVTMCISETVYSSSMITFSAKNSFHFYKLWEYLSAEVAKQLFNLHICIKRLAEIGGFTLFKKHSLVHNFQREPERSIGYVVFVLHIVGDGLLY